MKLFARALIVLVALVEGIAWTMFTAGIWQWGKSGAGVGVAGAGSASGAAALFAMVLIGAIWLLPTSPYMCMVAGALNLIEGKSLRVAYVYSLVVLSIITFIMLASFQARLELMALGNIVSGGLWAWSFRKNTPKEFESFKG